MKSKACWPESTACSSMPLIDFRRCSISRATRAISVPAVNRAKVTGGRQREREVTRPRVRSRAMPNRTVGGTPISPRIKSRQRDRSSSNNKQTMGIRINRPKVSHRAREIMRRILRNNHRANPPHPGPARAENKTPRSLATTNSPLFHPSGANGAVGFKFTLAAPWPCSALISASAAATASAVASTSRVVSAT